MNPTSANYTLRCSVITWQPIILATVMLLMGCGTSQRDKRVLQRLDNIDSRLTAIEQSLSLRQIVTQAPSWQPDAVTASLFPDAIHEFDFSLGTPADAAFSTASPAVVIPRIVFPHAPLDLLPRRDVFNHALLRLPHEREE